MDFIITEHAKRRYAERIMNREETYDINKFIIDHNDDIIKNISKMVQYGTKIYSGKMKEHNMAHFYVNGNWVIILDKDNTKVVTLYNVDLGCDDELNTMFVEKMMEQISDLNKTIILQQQKNLEENDKLRKENKEYEDRISDLKKQIKEYSNLIEANKMLIDNNIVLVSDLQSKYRDKIESLVRAKVF